MDNRRGIFLMVLSMAFFAMGDSSIKLASQTMATSQVMFWLIGGAVVIYMALLRYQRAPFWDPALLSRPVLGRCLAEGIGTVGMISALAVAPLATVAAIMQASPLVVTMLAALLLNEPVGWRRWSAICVGFLGVLLIVQPGSEGIEASSLLAVVGMAGMSVRDYYTKIAPPHLHTTTLANWTLLSIAPFFLVLSIWDTGGLLPAEPDWLIIIAMIVLGSAGYYAITRALRIAEISAIAPFRYSRLLFAIILGILLFQEWPDMWMLIGSALILGSGFYSMMRERRLAKTLHSD